MGNLIRNFANTLAKSSTAFANQLITNFPIGANAASATTVTSGFPSKQEVMRSVRGFTTANGSNNLALGRPYTATVGHNQYLDNSTASLTDGVDAGSFFQTVIPADIGWYSEGAHNDYVIIDLGRPCSIDKTRCYMGSNGSNVLYPTLSVYISLNNVDWTNVFADSSYINPGEATGKWLEQDFSKDGPFLARYVKFKCAQQAGKWSFAGEFQVWGKPVPLLNIVFTGDSLTADASSTYPAKMLAGLTGLGGVYKSTNIAVGGKLCQQLIEDDKTRADSLIVPGAHNVIMACWGTNDLFAGRKASQLAVDARTYCNDRKAAGFNDILVWTVTPRSSVGTDPGYETQRAIYNPWLRLHYNEFADGLIDIAANNLIGLVHAEQNAYFYSDLVHWTASGCGIAAGVALHAYNSLTVL